MGVGKFRNFTFKFIYFQFSTIHIFVGADDEKPEYSDASYFTMLFAAGIGIGLFYYGVAEPIYHMEPKGEYGNRYAGRCEIFIIHIDKRNLKC